MKRVREEEEIPWIKGDHPDAAKPLSAFRLVTITCNDCGHSKSLDEAALRDLAAVPTLGFLAEHAICTPCRLAGATGRANLKIERVPINIEAAPEPNWSRARVFTEDRTDPTPALPRRNIFDRRITQHERTR